MPIKYSKASTAAVETVACFTFLLASENVASHHPEGNSMTYTTPWERRKRIMLSH